jgi:hypothetical protein
MGQSGNRQDTQQPKPNAAVKRLEKLVGKWDMKITLPTNPPMEVAAWGTFELLEGGAFLAYRAEADRSDFPKNRSIIGSDETLDRYTMLYYDSRGVSRIYQMSLDDEAWKLWRDDPDFPQRFIGKFGDDGNTITGAWEKSTDGLHWELDFNLTYRRVE